MVKPILRFRIDFGVDEAVGPGKIALLEHISTSGSLSQAARDLKMSYARAWKLLESLNVCFVKPVAVMSTGGRGGGGAALTAFGGTLIKTYRAFEKATQASAARHFQPIATLARKTPARTLPARIRRLSDRNDGVARSTRGKRRPG
ncbi:MAG: LysR family transcriptional regulator [Pseudomonadota bacterium]|nr:LysR family transcriptional regulator [Pseudomonadota bacterium]